MNLDKENEKEQNGEESPSNQYKAFQWNIFSILQFGLSFLSRKPSLAHLHAFNNFKVSLHCCWCFLVKFIFTNMKRNVAVSVPFCSVLFCSADEVEAALFG